MKNLLYTFLAFGLFLSCSENKENDLTEENLKGKVKSVKNKVYDATEKNYVRDCNRFKTGSFKTVININGVEYTSVFKRNDSIQVEIFNNEIDSSYVRWINDCEVVFTTVNPKNLLQQKPILVKILRTFKDSYDFEYSYVGETTKQKGNATIFEPKSEAKSDAERFCEISKKMMAIKSRKTTIRDIENLDKWDIEVANFEKKYKNNEEFKKRYKACMKEK